MTDKIIDEVMDLVDAYAAMQGVDTYDQQVDAHDAIRAKLRDVLERKPMSVVYPEGFSNSFARVAYDQGWKGAERAHNIGDK